MCDVTRYSQEWNRLQINLNFRRVSLQHLDRSPCNGIYLKLEGLSLPGHFSSVQQPRQHIIYASGHLWSWLWTRYSLDSNVYTDVIQALTNFKLWEENTHRMKNSQRSWWALPSPRNMTTVHYGWGEERERTCPVVTYQRRQTLFTHSILSYLREKTGLGRKASAQETGLRMAPWVLGVCVLGFPLWMKLKWENIFTA